MSAKLIDGKKIAAEIESELKIKISKMDKPPRLSVVQVGEDPASTSYIRAKSNAAERVEYSKPEKRAQQKQLQAQLGPCAIASSLSTSILLKS